MRYEKPKKRTVLKPLIIKVFWFTLACLLAWAYFETIAYLSYKAAN